MTGRPIRVFLVEDSLVCLTILKRMLATSPDIELVGTAKHGQEALEKIPVAAPDVVCTDLEMPVMDGLALTRELMATYPRAILVVSNYVHEEHTHNIFQVLEAGAIDVFPKPRGGDESEFLLRTQELIGKIRILSGVMVFRKPGAIPPPSATVSTDTSASSPPTRSLAIMVIGASTGGPQALQVILQSLPADFPVPVICVQHISDGFLQGLVDWLASQCSITVTTAQPGARPESGVVYFPQEGRHLECVAGGTFRLSLGEPVEGHRPSVDVAFASVAKSYGHRAMGILLTGMGHDGAMGLERIREAGGLTIAQDESSSVVFGMPRRAIEMGAAAHVLPLTAIAGKMLEAVGRST